MCLEYGAIPENKNGIGYKIVRRTKDSNVFAPYYPYFYKDGCGGCNTNTIRDVFTATEQYCIGEKTTIDHNRMSRFDDSSTDETYRAGIHVYKEKQDCYNDLYVQIEVEYFNAICEDAYTIVVESIVPIAIV